jgi:hypothetical protein
MGGFEVLPFGTLSLFYHAIKGLSSMQQPILLSHKVHNIKHSLSTSSKSTTNSFATIFHPLPSTPHFLLLNMRKLHNRF